MDRAALIEKITQIEKKREVLENLLDRPDLGTLRLDVNQAIEELDDLVEEFKETFPEQ
ncbi:MAG: hypothetical protein GDA44_03285 [Prochloron sp. SP5CPC1]|nr:hypothetical protein [Candidatus Paraprochloron terpiosi SP5CPC1]